MFTVRYSFARIIFCHYCRDFDKNLARSIRTYLFTLPASLEFFIENISYYMLIWIFLLGFKINK